MPLRVMNFDLRHPAQFESSGAEVYAAALDMSAWADDNGFARIGLPEHHQNEDGDLPCPLLFAAALGGRTDRVRVQTGVALGPLYDPLRLAEEVAVADLCLRGRLVFGLGLGNLREDYAAFGADFAARGQTLEWLIPFLRRAWTGEPFEFRGATVRVTPKPAQDPMPILLGGMTRRSTDRAARLADGFTTATASTWDMYRRSCVKHGRPDPGPPASRGPLLLWVTKGSKADVRYQLEPHLAHQVESYLQQSARSGRRTSGPWAPESGAPPPFQILNPEETIELANQLGPTGELIFHPLLAGIDPSVAWDMLRTVEAEVLPYIG